MVARNRVDMIQISRQLAHSSMRITEEQYAHFHPDYMGQASDYSNQMLQNFLKPQWVPKKGGETEAKCLNPLKSFIFCGIPYGIKSE